MGMTLSLAVEGKKRNIFVNAIAPMAHTAMTKKSFPKSMRCSVKQISPVVLFLAHESCKRTGKIFELGGGWIS